MIAIFGSQFSERVLTPNDNTGTSILQQRFIEAIVRREPVFSRMKIKGICALFPFLLISISIPAQIVAGTDSAAAVKSTVNKQLKEIRKEKIQLHSDSTGGEPKKTTIDTTVNNKYDDLLNDDPIYNKKYPLWKPAVEVFELMRQYFCWTDMLANMIFQPRQGLAHGNIILKPDGNGIRTDSESIL